MSDHHDTAIEPAAVELDEPVQSESGVDALAAMAASGKLDTVALQQLLDAREREYQREARRAYTRALVGLRRDLPPVVRHDQLVDYTSRRTHERTRYTHTSLAAMMDAVQDPLVQHGFSASWRPATTDRLVTVTCRLTHRDGHYEEVSLSAPPDTSGKKSPAQAIASTVTILSRYTLSSLLGVATADMTEPTGQRGNGESKAAAVDQRRNLKVASRLRARGIDPSEAEQVVGNPVAEWTGEDIEAIGAWVRRRDEETAEREPGDDEGEE